MKLIIFILTILHAIVAECSINLEIDDKLINKIEKKYGQMAGKRMRTWQKLIDKFKDDDEDIKLKVVNRFFNQLNFVTDMVAWGKSDYWATPIEFMAIARGDCEDFSVAKYFTLRALGVNEDKLQLTYVKAIKLNQAHMVLTYYKTPDAEPLVLDNLEGNILPGSSRSDLLPLYSFNGSGLWKAKKTGIGRKIGDSARMKKWYELNHRIMEEI